MRPKERFTRYLVRRGFDPFTEEFKTLLKALILEDRKLRKNKSQLSYRTKKHKAKLREEIRAQKLKEREELRAQKLKEKEELKLKTKEERKRIKEQKKEELKKAILEKAERRKKTLEEKKQIKSETSKARYQRIKSDPVLYEQLKNKWRTKKRDLINKNKEEYYAKQREYYKRNAARLRESIYEGRRKRNPAHGIESAIRKFERGEIGLGELTSRFESALVQLDALADGSSGESLPRGHGNKDST